MGGSVTAPPPTAEENALRAQQTELLKMQQQLIMEQHDQQKMLMPIFAEQLGLQLEFDDQGNVVGATREDDPLDPKRKEIEEMFLDRSLSALRGELEINPGLERDLEKQEQELHERLQRQLGSGYESSSPGIEALQRFKESAEALRYGARHGDLTLAEQLGMARQMGNMQQTVGTQQQLGNIFGGGMQTAQGLGGVAGGYEMPIGQLQFHRQQQLNAQIANQQSSMAGLAGFGKLFGGIVGMFSDIRLKYDLEPLGVWIMGVPIFTYMMAGQRKIGVIAQHVPSEFVGKRDGFLTVDYWRLQ